MLLAMALAFAGAVSVSSQEQDDAAVLSMLAVVNAQRRTAGEPALELDGKLDALADERADDMVQRDYFSHLTPDGETPWQQMQSIGVTFHYAAENIAIASDQDIAATALWHSPEHRENTLGVSYHRIGIGVADRSDGTKVFVEDFTD